MPLPIQTIALRGKNAARLFDLLHLLQRRGLWEGIHTCMLTCVIVANPNVGSSYQKMVLRFGGAFAARFWRCYSRYWSCPLDNIVELLFVLAPIFLLGAWIATSSERSSYIGTQMVVTFALATLENVLARCTTGGNSRSRPGYHHWYRGVRGDLHLCLA